MVDKKSQGRGEKRTLRSASVGALVSLTVSLVANAVLAALIVNEKSGEQTMGYAVLAGIAISAVIGAYISIHITDGKYMITALINGGLFISALLLVNIIFYGGEFDGILVTAGVILAVCISAALLAPGMGKSTHKKVKRRKNR